jgi:hypothetical protein
MTVAEWAQIPDDARSDSDRRRLAPSRLALLSGLIARDHLARYLARYLARTPGDTRRGEATAALL